MRILFIIVLVVNLLTELLAATTLIGGPDGIAAAGKGAMWSMHYGSRRSPSQAPRCGSGRIETT